MKKCDSSFFWWVLYPKTEENTAIFSEIISSHLVFLIDRSVSMMKDFIDGDKNILMNTYVIHHLRSGFAYGFR